MTTHQALVLNSTSAPLSFETRSIPVAGPGSVVIRVLGTYILPYLSSILDGSLPYALYPPLVPGSNCIGRVHAVGPDATSLSEAQLVLCDMTVRARDDPSKAILMGLHGGAAMRLMEGEWRDGCFAQYAKFPLENCFALDEELLCGKMGYTIEDLCTIPSFLVPFGGLSDIGVLPGDTVIVAPATGRFGGGAVTTALAIGASVVACGRNEGVLTAMNKVFGDTGRLTTLILTGDVEKDTKAMIKAAGNGGKGADAYINFSPAAAAGSTHISAALAALKFGGRAVFMGGIPGKVQIDYILVMLKSLRIQGKFMYERDTVAKMVKMIEKGNLKLGEMHTGAKTVAKFGLEDIQEAMQVAKKESGWGKQVVLLP
ncbi:hypothetical protein G7Y89_g774 [Cudoniella acicularis]|uniref:Isopropanol dehydrogenase n=1 Tax=Cudoniella acicularis TaxID=354080 RepID=A0A8H4RWK5_9HELO|nr:hypothetical protein G7Y89_g774 [Cudoniella acicularis]